MNTRHDGSPFATEMTDKIRDWFRHGGIDPARILSVPDTGLTEAHLLTLWNLRVKPPDCTWNR